LSFNPDVLVPAYGQSKQAVIIALMPPQVLGSRWASAIEKLLTT